MPRSELTELAAEIGSRLRVARPPSEIAAIGRMFAARGMTREILREAYAEACAKRPKLHVIDGLLFLFGEAADELRVRGNGGNVAAHRELAGIMAHIASAPANKRADPGMLMALAQTLSHAGLDPPEGLQLALSAAMAARGPAANARLAQARAHAEVDRMAQRCGEDPFKLYLEFAAMASAFPVNAQPGFAAGLFEHANPAVRAAALGFVLHRDLSVARAALAGCAEAALREDPDPALAMRLVMMRPWLCAELRASADPLIAMLRKRGPEGAAPHPLSVDQCFASPCDGAGAQSVFAVAKDGRKWALASLLIKTESGVSDAWVARGLLKRDITSLRKQLSVHVDGGASTLEFFRRRLADALAANAKTIPPPFGLVQICEYLGLGLVTPNRVGPSDLIDELLAALPAAQKGSSAREEATLASIAWPDTASFADTWFEAGLEVEALLAPIRGSAKRADAVLFKLLPARREFWLGQLAWSALALKDRAEYAHVWRDITLVADALRSAKDVRDVPLMVRIAFDTVRAFEGR